MAVLTASPVEPAYIRQKDLPRYLGCTKAFLIQLIRKGEGPPRIKKGRAVFYRLTDLHTWMESDEGMELAA